VVKLGSRKVRKSESLKDGKSGSAEDGELGDAKQCSTLYSPRTINV
jgi:hypothetical protein